MATIYQNPSLKDLAVGPSPDGTGYTTYQEPDTRVPPKPRAMLAVVSVDGVTIMESDILQEAQNHPAENPGAALLAAARALVVRQLLLNEADRRGIYNGASAIGITEKPNETPEDAAIRQLIEDEIAVPRATLSECRRYYDNNPERFTNEALYEVRHILIGALPDDHKARERACGLAQDICQKLQAHPEQFAEFAKTYSDCQSNRNGGNLGQVGKGSTVPEFERALQQLHVGAITNNPIETRYGFHVIALDRAIQAELLPFEAVRERIAAWLEAGTWTRACSQFISILAGQSKITGVEIDGSKSPLVQ